MKYHVETLAKEDVYFMTLTLGFRIEPRINYFFDMALHELEECGEVNITSRHPRSKNTTLTATCGSFCTVRFYLMKTNSRSKKIS